MHPPNAFTALRAVIAAWLIAACLPRPPPRSPPAAVGATFDAGRAVTDLAPIDAAPAPTDSGLAADAGAFVRSELLPNVLDLCASDRDATGAGAGSFRLGPTGWRSDLLAPDQRAVVVPVDVAPSPDGAPDVGSQTVTMPARVALARHPDGREAVFTAGFIIAGVEEADCARLIAFDWRARTLVHRGSIARIDGPPVAGAVYWLRTNGPYNGAGLLVVADAQDAPRWVRYFDGPSVLDPSTLGVFAAGESFVVYTVEDGMNFGSPTRTSLVALAADGLVELVSVSAGISTENSCFSVGDGEAPEEDVPLAAIPQCRVRPPGGIRVLARGAAPRLAVITSAPVEGTDGDPLEWYERTERYSRRPFRFAPAQRRFVPAGGASWIRLRPRVERLPVAR